MDFSGAVPLIFNLPKGQTGASWKLSAKKIFHQKRQIHWYQNILQKHHFLLTFYKDMGWVLTGFMPDFMAPGELWGLWLWDSLGCLWRSPETWHIAWVLWGLLGSMPHNWKCRSHDSQAVWFPALLWLAGLWTPCRFIWADGVGGSQEHLVTLLSQESWSWAFRKLSFQA